jgi:hypothetical protein
LSLIFQGMGLEDQGLSKGLNRIRVLTKGGLAEAKAMPSAKVSLI